MTDLTAIDILVHPDSSMIDLAKQANPGILTSTPAPPGFALDEHHQPHITTLQRYVRTADLDKVFAAVKGVVDGTDLRTLTFTAETLWHMTGAAYPGIGLAAIVAKPSPE